MNNNVVEQVLKIFNNNWNKQVILYGPPGTSKTYSSTIIAAAKLAGYTFLNNGFNENDCKKTIIEKIANKVVGEKKPEEKSLYEVAKEYLKDNKNYKLVQFHPSYSYEDFVRGITVRTNGNNVNYTVESKIIEKFAKGCNEGNLKVLVIDEINSENYHEIEKCLGESKGIDVTGGMKGKINELMLYAKQCDMEAFVFDGNNDNLLKFLNGEHVGTKVSK